MYRRADGSFIDRHASRPGWITGASFPCLGVSLRRWPRTEPGNPARRARVPIEFDIAKEQGYSRLLRGLSSRCDVGWRSWAGFRVTRTIYCAHVRCRLRRLGSPKSHRREEKRSCEGKRAARDAYACHQVMVLLAASGRANRADWAFCFSSHVLPRNTADRGVLSLPERGFVIRTNEDELEAGITAQRIDFGAFLVTS
jgi:hypothetical protein